MISREKLFIFLLSLIIIFVSYLFYKDYYLLESILRLKDSETINYQKKYIDKNLGFSLEIPTDWRPYASGQEPYWIGSYGWGVDNLDKFIGWVELETNFLDPQDFASLSIRAATDSLSLDKAKSKIFSDKTVAKRSTVNKIPSFVSIIDEREKQYPNYSEHILIKYNNIFYSFDFSSISETRINEWHNILRSFRILD